MTLLRKIIEPNSVATRKLNFGKLEYVEAGDMHLI